MQIFAKPLKRERRMKKVLFGLILLSLLAAVAVALATRSPFEEAVLVANTKEWGPQGQADLEQYPTTAPRVFALYGHTPEFAEVLRRYGHNQLVPVVAKCLQQIDTLVADKGYDDNKIRDALKSVNIDPIIP